MAEQYATGYKYHLFFIHSSVDGHLSCFHALRMGENICKQSNWQGISLQNTQTAYTAQYKKETNNPIKKWV